jgi:hypothetical protein
VVRGKRAWVGLEINFLEEKLELKILQRKKTCGMAQPVTRRHQDERKERRKKKELRGFSSIDPYK